MALNPLRQAKIFATCESALISVAGAGFVEVLAGVGFGDVAKVAGFAKQDAAGLVGVGRGDVVEDAMCAVLSQRGA